MTKTYTRSFAGGEMSPQLFGRIDLGKFQTGLAKCLNFLVTPQGPIQNRPGFKYVNKCKLSTAAVLIPFSFSTQQTFALEFGVSYIRFHTNGATLLEAAKNITGITQANPGVFTSTAHGFVNNDWIHLSGIGGMTALNGRFGIVANATANTFTLTDLFGVAINTSALPEYTTGGTASRVFEIATPYAEADLLDLHYVQSADVMTICHPAYAPRELRRLGATNWTLSVVSFVPTIGTPGTPTLTTGGPGGGAPITHTYAATAIATEGLEESLPSAEASASFDLTVSGNTITVAVPAVTGAVRYNVYKKKNGLLGFIGQTTGSLVDNNIAPDTSKTPSLINNPFDVAGNFPQAVSYFEQRKALGGSTNKPQNVWLTRSGTESNMSYSIPTRDDDSITMRIVAREVNVVRHLVPLNDLLALTSGGVWKISSANSDVLTPASTSARPQGYEGASNAQPVVTSRSVLYAQSRGGHIFELSYKWESQSYESGDISVLSSHLFDAKTAIQMAYAKAPVQNLWVVRNDGILLGLTYVPEHEVRAWHQHNTLGTFKSVATVAEGDEDGVYVIVLRTIKNQLVRYVERLSTRQFSTTSDAFFVDAGATYSGTPASVISGIWHLDGEKVSILADGGVEPTQTTVVDGKVTLSAPASKVHIGLPYQSDMQTLPFAYEAPAFGQGGLKNISEVWLRVLRSSSIKAGPAFDKLRTYAQRTAAVNYGLPPELVTDVISIKIDPKWQENGSVSVRQSDPLPLDILSLSMEGATST